MFLIYIGILYRYGLQNSFIKNLDLIKYLKSQNVTVSVGHSAAGYEDFVKSIKEGLTCVTHTYNGMKPLRRDEIGTVGSAFYLTNYIQKQYVMVFTFLNPQLNFFVKINLKIKLS